jgi:glutamyl-Q tRNA(Asp) synthetase
MDCRVKPGNDESSAMPQPVFRFAPSPNGYLHLGHACSALLNADMAKAAGGRLLLRIEDIDRTRCRPEFEQAIYEDLAWLGVSWEEPVRRQSEHLDAYRNALTRLDAMGLIYPSFESRGEVARRVAEHGGDWPRDPDGAPIYPGGATDVTVQERARRMAAGEPYALRINMAKAVGHAGDLTWKETGAGPEDETGLVSTAPLAWGDAVLARKDVPTSYHLSVVVDDALQGITHVVRGLDLFWSTSVHRLLQTLLGLPAPLYHHHKLILDAEGRKLSKSTESTSLRELRQAGATPADIRAMTGLS